MGTRNYFPGEELELDKLGDGLSRKVLAQNKNLMMVEVYFEAGTVAPVHSHPHEQCTYVIEGEFEFTIGETTRIVVAGDSMYKQPHIPHGAKCLQAGRLLDVFTPRRDDFLKG